jgi:hypothetical protein
MCRKFINAIFFCAALPVFLSAQAFGQEKIDPQAYVAANVPDSLKENANSVVRFFEQDIEVKGPGKESIKVHKIVTILNEKGDDEAVFELVYSKKYDSYSSIEMKVYDPAGNVIKKYHRSDMYDGAASDGFSLVTDERFLGVKHTVSSYPETIEIEYEEDITSNIDLGYWDIQQDEQSIQNASCQVLIDANAGFRYSNQNTTIQPQTSQTDGKSLYIWGVKNLKAIKLEERAEPWRVLPKIYFASNNFVYYGVPGNLSSWKTYGDWQKGLNSDVCSLTPQREAEIRKMTDSIKTDKEKAKFLYSYMQKNMRYVSIQLGIGGLKPFPASFVDEKKYGDCKALCNYMCALLKAVGIPAYYAKVRAGANEEPYNPAFPNDISNHIIVCVPFKTDTTWLECTNPFQPFGKLGTFTENRNALIITEDGGRLVNTPHSTMKDNQLNSEAHISLDADGGAKANVKLLATGVYRDEYIGDGMLKVDEQKEDIMHRLNLKQPISFEVTPKTDLNGVKEVDLNLEYDKFCDIAAGDKQFYRPHVFDLVAFTVPAEDHRKSDYYFETPIVKTCVTTIDLPAGFDIETMPANQSLSFTYGAYEVKYAYDAAKNQVVSNAKFNITNQVIPAAKYNELQEFLDAVAKAQNKKLVIKRKA